MDFQAQLGGGEFPPPISSVIQWRLAYHAKRGAKEKCDINKRSKQTMHDEEPNNNIWQAQDPDPSLSHEIKWGKQTGGKNNKISEYLNLVSNEFNCKIAIL